MAFVGKSNGVSWQGNGWKLLKEIVMIGMSPLTCYVHIHVADFEIVLDRKVGRSKER